MEYLYHVDENDDVIGKVSRKRAHDDLLRHRTGIIFLVDNKERIFLTERSPEKQPFGGCYDSSSSFHVRYGESYEEAAKREGKEELGLKNEVELLGKFFHFDPPSNHVVAVFKMEYCGKTLEIGVDEIQSGEFLPLEQVKPIIKEKDVTPWLRDGYDILRENIRSR